MISVAEAITLIKANTALLSPQTLSLNKSCGLVLAEDVYAESNVPPFHQSAMDGYAFRYEDYLQSKEFTVSGEVAAGDKAEASFAPQNAVRIFTGAPLPAWADTVVMQEKTEALNDVIIVTDEALEKGSNVRTEGFEIRKGEAALAKGTLLTPAAIGFLAGVGIAEVMIHPKPKVHIIVTGNELQDAGQPLAHGQIYESNSMMLESALWQLHITDVNVSKAIDDLSALQAELTRALKNANLILLTGGVSVGKYDFVVQAAEACGVKQVFHKVAQRPGKPLYFGTKDDKVVFGLPGNPASVLSCFYNFTIPAVESMTGRSNLLKKKELPLSVAVSKKIKLTQFLKAVYGEDSVTPLTAQESFRLSSFALANCLVVLPAHKMEFAKGEPVETLLLPYL